METTQTVTRQTYRLYVYNADNATIEYCITHVEATADPSSQKVKWLIDPCGPDSEVLHVSANENLEIIVEGRVVAVWA